VGERSWSAGSWYYVPTDGRELPRWRPSTSQKTDPTERYNVLVHYPTLPSVVWTRSDPSLPSRIAQASDRKWWNWCLTAPLHSLPPHGARNWTSLGVPPLFAAARPLGKREPSLECHCPEQLASPALALIPLSMCRPSWHTSFLDVVSLAGSQLFLFSRHPTQARSFAKGRTEASA